MLVGDEKSLAAQEKLWREVKRIQPKCLEQLVAAFPWRKGLSTALRTTNPLVPAQKLVARDTDSLVKRLNVGPPWLDVNEIKARTQPKYTWPEPPDERRDTRHFFSAPDSLYIRADIPGHQSYRFQERPVRYDTKMKLRFWYLIAVGTEGECRVRVGQNKDTPLAWRQLHEGGFDERLKTIGHWTKYERIVQTEPEATRMILEFKIVGEIDSGEMWIDDVNLEPVGIIGPGGP